MSPHPAGQRRLWRARAPIDGGVIAYLARVGRPIRYSYVHRSFPTAAYQTVFAREPGSAEMPSAARPFTTEIVTDLVSRGIGVAPILLHTGVSSQDAGEPPQPERFRVPESTARQVNMARAWGNRVDRGRHDGDPRARVGRRCRRRGARAVRMDRSGARAATARRAWSAG